MMNKKHEVIVDVKSLRLLLAVAWSSAVLPWLIILDIELMSQIIPYHLFPLFGVAVATPLSYFICTKWTEEMLRRTYYGKLDITSYTKMMDMIQRGETNKALLFAVSQAYFMSEDEAEHVAKTHPYTFLRMLEGIVFLGDEQKRLVDALPRTQRRD